MAQYGGATFSREEALSGEPREGYTPITIRSTSDIGQFLGMMRIIAGILGAIGGALAIIRRPKGKT